MIFRSYNLDSIGGQTSKALHICGFKMDNGTIVIKHSIKQSSHKMVISKPIACLAPMDGITDMAYRRIVRRLNPDVVLFSEFTSVNGIEHSDLVRRRLDFKQEELPYIVQLFGNEPPLFEKTVQQFQNSGISGIDINMGCPAKKIVKANSGGSLMKERDLACRIVESCARNSRLPVSVKTRLGWSDSDNLLYFIQGMIDAGAQMITIHGRTYKQRFKGVADWNPIYGLKKSVTVPVIGNGDLTDRDHALEKIENLDGYMIGRASIGNPWVFLPEAERHAVTLKTRISTMLDHFQLLREYKEEQKSLIEFRKHISGYINGFNGAKACRTLLMGSRTEKDFIHNALSIV